MRGRPCGEVGELSLIVSVGRGVKGVWGSVLIGGDIFVVLWWWLW